MTTDKPESTDAVTTLEAIFQARRGGRILVRMPKSVRSTFAEALASSIDDAFSTGDDISWSKLLSFASVVSSRDHDSSTSLATIVRNNLLKFNSSLPAWTIPSPTDPHFSKMTPT